jgi:hypothetical protein
MDVQLYAHVTVVEGPKRVAQKGLPWSLCVTLAPLSCFTPFCPCSVLVLRS